MLALPPLHQGRSIFPKKYDKNPTMTTCNRDKPLALLLLLAIMAGSFLGGCLGMGGVSSLTGVIPGIELELRGEYRELE